MDHESCGEPLTRRAWLRLMAAAAARRGRPADGAVAPAAARPEARPDADPQSARLAHAPGDVAGMEGLGSRSLRRRDPLHIERLRRARACPPERDARLRPGQLLAGRA